MGIYWFQDEDGKNVLPFMQLKAPLRVNDDFIEFKGTGVSTGYIDEGSDVWNELQNVVEGDIEFSEIHSFAPGNGTNVAVDVINTGSDNKITLKSDSNTLEFSAIRSGTGLNLYSGSDVRYLLDGEIDKSFAHGNIRFGSGDSGTYATPFFIRDYTGQVRVITIKRGREGSFYFSKSNYREPYTGSGLNPLTEIPAVVWKTFPNTYDAPIMKEEGIVDMKDRYSPKTQTSGIGIYPLNRQQITEFTFDLWEETFTEKINKLVNGDPMKSILALRWYYGIAPAIPRTEKSTYLTLGNVNFNGNMTQSAVITKPARSEIITYSMGAITIPRKFNNFLDFSPFTRVQVYIPYVGFTELEATVVMGRKIRLDYNINITTGASIAYLYVEEGMNKWRIIQEQGCVVGVDIPLSIESSDTIGSRIVTSIAGAGATAVGAGAGMMGGPIGAGAAAASIAGGMISNSLNSVQSMSGQSSRTVGGLNSDTGSMGEFQPHVTITRPVPKAPEGYNKMVGKPDYRITKVGNMSGYIKVGSIASQNEVAPLVNGIPKEAMDEIDQLLKAGVYTR